ncbi:outer membrane immunogenic protein [Sphingomonas guangdongensis]|uniref:Outer membrane immunogenic protein n=1 Tax=Sphingomonas guangdongensis TaxID=1141890 RepID=A0A285QXE0_9SPHN|nr:opacity protein [Sphingomonas guangdongensis]SOB86511.1 outer membrane immunogenic protein [Sphingomonas guangdongensis]
MRSLFTAAAFAAIAVASPALAQDVPAETTADTGTVAEAPDGSPAFGIEPYIAIRGGWEQFDSEPNSAGIPGVSRNNELNGSLVEGLVGFNVPLGPVFVGAEGNVAKGLSGDIDWQYGAAGRFGVRAGDSGLIYGRVGYQWVNFEKRVPTNRDFNDVTYGAGFEVGPKDIGLGGITGNSGFRLRGEVSTFGDFHSFRPTLGIVTHF